jgi:uncharacterized protein (TIGR03067 family)
MLVEPREAQPRTSTFTLTAGRPSRIDLTTVYPNTGKHLHTQGIYALQDDALTYCLALPGQPRPAAFATRKGDGHILVVAKRVVPERR